jgi:hypothetical protein
MVNFHLAVGDSTDETMQVHCAPVVLAVCVYGVPVSVRTPLVSRHTFIIGIVNKSDEALSQLDGFHRVFQLGCSLRSGPVGSRADVFTARSAVYLAH